MRPLPSLPPRAYTRHRPPTSPPPVILYAEFTPTPSPEIVPTSLPAESTPGRDPMESVSLDEEDEEVWAPLVFVHIMINVFE